MTTVKSEHKMICEAKERRTPSLSFLPSLLKVTTVNPEVQPKANCKKIKVSGNVSLTPATSSALSVLPQIAASLSV